MIPPLRSLVTWTPVPNFRLICRLIAFSDPEHVWVRWASGDEERVNVDEIEALV